METKQPDDAQKTPSQPAASAGSSKETFFKVGPRETDQDNFDDVLKALGVVHIFIVSNFANLGVAVLAVIIHNISPEFAGQLFPSLGLSDLGSLFQFYLSTFPLVLGTTVYTMLLLTNSIKTFGGGLVALGIVYGLAIGIGGFFGVGGVHLSELHFERPLAPGTAAFGDLANRIINLFWITYGPYRFFVSIFAGAVNAWALIIKTKRSAPTKRDH